MNKKILVLGLGILILAGVMVESMHTLLLIPSEVTQFEGDKQTIDFNLPWGIKVTDSSGILKLADQVEEGFVLSAEKTGSYQFTFDLLGIPLKRMQVNVIPQIELTPSGHSIGVKLSDYGVMVAGLDSIKTNGGIVEPARASGFQVGDILISVNDIKLINLEHAADVLEEKSQPGVQLKCGILRSGKKMIFNIEPVYDETAKKYRLGLLLRDTSAGVGTMTFYHAETGIYGALGHMITNETGGGPLELSSGQIVNARILSIQPGQRGKPGEKKGTFDSESGTLGTIHTNTELGIFGRLTKRPDSESAPIPLGFRHQIKVGEAEILTVIEGNKVERFTIEIEKVFIQNQPAGKGMVLRITDPRLLTATGGIVQGMSGSPIIQDGRLVGAVTHVFINEPNRGYGCFAEWMVLESGLFQDSQTSLPPSYRRFFIFSVSREMLK